MLFLLPLLPLLAGGPSMAQATWTQRNPSTPLTALRSVAWTGTQLAAVGDGGVVISSSDAGYWTTQNSGTGSTLYDLTGNSGLIVAVGQGGMIRTASNSNPAPWSNRTSPTANALYGVARSGNLYVAVGASGTIVTSSNGTGTGGGGNAWTLRSSGTTQGLNAVAGGSGRYVVVGDNGIILTSENGTTGWTERVSRTTQSLVRVVWADNQFVAVGFNGSVSVSPDGISWTSQVSGTAQTLSGLEFSNGTWVVVGNSGVILASADAVTWTPSVSGTSQSLRDVVWSDSSADAATGQFVAVGVGGILFTSPDGITWSRNHSSTSTLFGMAWGVGRYVAVGASGTILTSPNGTAWTSRTSGTGSQLLSVSDNGSRFVAVGFNGTIVSSSDGVTWEPQASGTSERFNFVRWGGTRFVAVGNAGMIATSPDGQAWTLQNSQTNAGLYSVVWTGSRFYAVGASGTILSSSDGQFWTARNSGITDVLYSVRSIGSHFVAVGAGGRILLSADGAMWDTVSSMTNKSLYSLAWTGSRLVATGAGGVVTTSPNGVTWDLQTSGVTADLYTVEWTGSQFAAVGPGGLILTADAAALPLAPGAPLLITPSQNSTGVSVQGTILSWSSASGVSWHVQRSKDPAFSVLERNDSGLTSAASPTGTLEANTVYYWRVRAKASGYSSHWSEVRSFSTGTLPAPLLSSPLPAAQDVALSTTLTWGTVPAASTYHAQLSSQASFSGPLLLDDSSLTGGSRPIFGLTANAVYYWRVRAKNASGVSAWSQSRSFGTVAMPPPAPILGSPAESAFPVSVFTAFAWQASAGATTYRFQLATDSGFTTLVVHDSLLTGTSRSGGQLTGSTPFYWRMRARNAVGFGDWSPVRQFMTGPTPTTRPAAPVLVTPSQFATGVPLSTQFLWNASEGAARYRIQLSTSGTFASTVLDDSTLTGLSRTVTNLTGSVSYYWRVSAVNPIGQGDWSEVWTFATVGAAPTVAPGLVSPVQFSTGIAVPSPLTWSAVAGASGYRVQVSLTSDFAAPAFESANVAGVTVNAPGLGGNTDYYWRVAARNSAGTGPYSVVWRFTTGAVPPPSAPSPLTPAQFATDVPLAANFTWTASSGASTYHLQISTAVDFSTAVFNDSGFSTASRTGPSLLEPQRNYYWRVRAKNASGVSEWSTVSRFSTVTTALLPGQITLSRTTMTAGGELRFVLAYRQRVTVRLRDVRGRLTAPVFDEVRAAGFHSLVLPPGSGSLQILEFRADGVHRTLLLQP